MTQKQPTVFEWKGSGQHVLLASTFTGWKAYPMSYHSDTSTWSLRVPLIAGTYHYNYVVDGEWCVDHTQPTTATDTTTTATTQKSTQKSKKSAQTKATDTRAVTAVVDSSGAASVHNVVVVKVKGSEKGHGRQSINFGSGSEVVVERLEDLWGVVESGSKVTFGDKLRNAYLVGMGLTDKHATVILEPLKKKNNINSLNLSHNPLGDGFVKQLISVLPPSIQNLSLSSTNLSDTSAQYLADYLSSSPSLTSLQLRSNHLTATGARHLARALEQNTRLTTLDLWCNPVGEEGLLELAKSVRHSKSLREIHVGNGELHRGKQAASACKEWIKTLTDNECSLSDVHLITNDRKPFTNTLEELKKV